MRRPRAVVAVALLAALVLVGCTGVPESSAPQVIRTLPVGPDIPQIPPVTPTPGESPRNLILSFLMANAEDSSNRSSARTFLTPAARSRWSDSTVTVVDITNTGGNESGKPQITVRGRVLGTVNSAGVYTSSLQGAGGPLVSFVYGITKVKGQYRINNPVPGLLLTQAQFLQEYAEHSVYFYDLAHRYLVPDPRWSSLTDPTQLAEWLMNELAAGPTDALQNAVSNDTLPAQATARRITVTGGAVMRIDIPGTSQFDDQARNRLAGQLARMIDDGEASALEITDGGTPVRIPDAGGTVFTGPEFTEAYEPPTPAAEVFYLRNGRLMDQRGKRVPGAVNNGTYYLTSVAVSRSTPGRALAVAAESSIAGSPTLLVGTAAGGLHRTSVTGVTSRPAFAPSRDEVWVAAGAQIRRVAVSSKTTTAYPVAVPASIAGGRIVALRLSPEGSRIALAIRSPNGQSGLYVGAVVRGSAGLVRVDTLTQVSQEGAVVTDVGWLESLKLFAIGSDSDAQDGRIFDVGVDGSEWTDDGIGELPDPPVNLTVTQGEHVWVTSNNSVWVQSGGSSWYSPGIGSSTPGYEPVYLE